MTTRRSDQLLVRSRRVIPGGVNSPARAFGAVGGRPRFVSRAAGARIVDEDGVERIDFVNGWGALLHGHAPRCVIDALTEAARDGVLLGLPTRREAAYAERFLALIGWAAQVRLANSGTEAVMTAVRLARAATNRSAILTFDGGYHGHSDAVLIQTGGDGRAPFNDLDAVRAIVGRQDLAAIIVEPVAANMGVVPPAPGFLEGLRALCTTSGPLLIFDEVVTGFRVAPGGAAERFGVTPDLAAYGKIAGGGLPIGAVAGPAGLMALLSPEGPVPHAGTFAGNPLTTAAGLAVLDALVSDDGVYRHLEGLGAALEFGVRRLIDTHGYPCVFHRVGSMWSLFLADGPVTNWESAVRTSRPHFAQFFNLLLDRGVYLSPSPLEAHFLSAAHTAADIAVTIAAIEAALAEVYGSHR